MISPGSKVEISIKEKEDSHWRGIVVSRNTFERIDGSVSTILSVQWFSPTGEPRDRTTDHYEQELREAT